MTKPIFRIKKNQSATTPSVPSSLNQSELAIDLVSNKLYCGTGTSVVQIGSTISNDATFPANQNESIPTQFATKAYILANYNTGGPPPPPPPVPPKNVCDIRVLTWRPIIGGQQGTSIDGSKFIFSSFFPTNLVVTQNPAFIQYGEDFNINQFNTTGLYQTTVNNMYLHVSYSVVYSPPNPSLTNWWC